MPTSFEASFSLMRVKKGKSEEKQTWQAMIHMELTRIVLGWSRWIKP